MGKIFNIKKFPMDVGRITYVFYGLFRRVKLVKSKDYEKIKGGAIIVANHTGFSDPHTIGAAFLSRRVHFMASSEVMGKGLRRLCMKGMGCISVDRGIFDLESMKKCIKILKEGYVLAVFPQGKIVKDGEVDDIKSGAALIAARAGVPIIPAHVNYTDKFYQRKKVVAGKAFYPDEIIKTKRPTNEDIGKLTEEIQKRMVECENKGELLK